MITIRTAARMAAFLAVTTQAYVLRLLSLPVCRLVPAWNRPIRGALFRLWARQVLWAIGMNVSVSGSPPKAPFFLVSNHLGYVDIALLAAHVNAVFVSRHDLADWPFIGPVTRLYDTLFINRERPRDIPAVAAKLSDLLDKGEGVVVFPEGTSSGGDGILPLKPALLSLPARRAFPVHCVVIHYETPGGHAPASQSVCWWGDMEFIPHFKGLLSLPRITARITFIEKPVQAEHRKELAGAVEACMLSVFEPVDQVNDRTTQ